MHPVLIELGSFSLSSYAFFVGLGVLVAVVVRRAELTRLGYTRDPAHRWVGLGALVGAMLGSKLGMLLFIPLEGMHTVWDALRAFDFTGKTVVGGLIGGYLGVELSKKCVGIRHSTGDGWAVALPLSQAFGRIGCFFNGCCYGTPTEHGWGVPLLGVVRHPTALYEAGLDLLLAAALYALRLRPRPAGWLFHYYLIGYSSARFGLEFIRGDAALFWGPLTPVQWVCLTAAAGFSAKVFLSRGTHAIAPA